MISIKDYSEIYIKSGFRLQILVSNGRTTSEGAADLIFKVYFESKSSANMSGSCDVENWRQILARKCEIKNLLREVSKSSFERFQNVSVPRADLSKSLKIG